MQDKIVTHIQKGIHLRQKILDHNCHQVLSKMAEICAASIKKGGKILFCGNGGSAADAQHIAAEFIVRLVAHRDRSALPAINLAMDSSTMTACANDYGYDYVFARPLEALGREGDILLGITTSGNSKNVIQAFMSAKKMGIQTFGFLNHDGGKALQFCDHAFLVPSDETALIQEIHITAGHVFAELVEDLIFY